MDELHEESYLRDGERDRIVGWEKEYNLIYEKVGDARREELRRLLTAVARLIVTQAWDELHSLCREATT